MLGDYGKLGMIIRNVSPRWKKKLDKLYVFKMDDKILCRIGLIIINLNEIGRVGIVSTR